MPSPEDSSSNIARDLRAAGALAGLAFKELSDNQGLTPSQASLLSRLGKEGDASASALAAAERIRPQAVVPTLAALQERGLIERRPDPSDGRRLLISLSPAGRTMFQGAQLEGDEWLTKAIQDRLTPAERTTLVEALKLLERLTTD